MVSKRCAVTPGAMRSSLLYRVTSGTTESGNAGPVRRGPEELQVPA
jgi:hypothetical protein